MTAPIAYNIGEAAEAAKIARGFIADLRARVKTGERRMTISLLQAEGLADAIETILGDTQGGADG